MKFAISERYVGFLLVSAPKRSSEVSGKEDTPPSSMASGHQLSLRVAIKRSARHMAHHCPQLHDRMESAWPITNIDFFRYPCRVKSTCRTLQLKYQKTRNFGAHRDQIYRQQATGGEEKLRVRVKRAFYEERQLLPSAHAFSVFYHKLEHGATWSWSWRVGVETTRCLHD